MADYISLGMKIAEQKPMTPQELQDWRRFLVDIQRSNSVINSFVGPDNKENIVPKFPGVKVSLTSQAISNNSLTTLQWTTEEYDESDFFASTNNTQIVCRTGGTYFVNGGFAWDVNGTGIRGAVLNKNGVNYTGNVHNTVSGSVFANNISTELTVVSGDYLTIDVVQTSGGSLNCTPAFLSVRLLR